MNTIGHRNELRHYNQQRRAERMDSIIAKVCAIGLVAYVLFGVFA